MRRIIATVACAGTAALMAPAIAAPAYAQTRAADPASALVKQIKPKQGVHVTSAAKVTMEGITAFKFRSEGDVQFGRSGAAASDMTSKSDFGGLFGGNDDLDGMKNPLRTVIINGTSYLSGGVYDDLLPDGKSWLRMPGGNAANLDGNLGINTFDPSTLKAVLATTKAKSNGGTLDGVRTTRYRGSITLRQLYAASPATRKHLKDLKPADGKAVINWNLWIGADQLVRRLTTATTMSFKVKKSSMEMSMTGDTKFSKWGSKLNITAPKGSEVASLGDIVGDVPEVPDVINLGD
ncbi:hypothetical protein [Microtetraspora fusca]|uniref:LppX_LprAFG lipoprotein n=1 Tax=Microtetraspora fusca TaxID=1997 RepID=A0ABW6V1A5_MICFU|nr:hypothetical protein [Microtetraspora fusca]